MKTILEYLEKTVETYPDRKAVTDLNGNYTYAELLEKAKKAGSALAGQISHQEPVVILMEKSCQAVAMLYGVLYAGGFYIFVDPDQPAERMSKIFGKLQAKTVIADDTEKNREILSASGFSGKQFTAEELLQGEIEEEKLKKVRQQAEDTDILYGIFTSGSTGMPKGVMVSHKAAADFIGHFVDTFGITYEDRIGNQAPFDFDVSVKDIYSACRTGAELVLIPRTYFAQIKRLMDYLEEKKVTVLVWAVSAVCLISGFRGFRYKVPQDLRMVMFSGEIMPPKQLRIWQDALPQVRFVNLYGPSEITCNCTYHEIEKQYADEEDIPIGHAFAGRIVFLLDEGKLIQKAGLKGEICVAGESLANGYYNDPDKTADAFQKILIEGEERRFYHTGDLGSYDENGILHFHGRADSQIKHMGHRIELGEIESAMLRLPGISRGCCLFDQKKNRMVAFYTGDLTSAEIKTELKTMVPNYMVPSKMIWLDSFELNKNGKIDRNKLKEKMETL
jgi:D-alanine--poly(phosphoribitol) ligase subunit 1